MIGMYATLASLAWQACGGAHFWARRMQELGH